MGKIIASYLIKAHLHAPDDADEETLAKASSVTNEAIKEAVIDGLFMEVPEGGSVTVSLIERTDD